MFEQTKFNDDCHLFLRFVCRESVVFLLAFHLPKGQYITTYFLTLPTHPLFILSPPPQNSGGGSRRRGRGGGGGELPPELVAARDGHEGIDAEEVVVDGRDNEAVPRPDDARGRHRCIALGDGGGTEGIEYECTALWLA